MQHDRVLRAKVVHRESVSVPGEAVVDGGEVLDPRQIVPELDARLLRVLRPLVEERVAELKGESVSQVRIFGNKGIKGLTHLEELSSLRMLQNLRSLLISDCLEPRVSIRELK